VERSRAVGDNGGVVERRCAMATAELPALMTAEEFSRRPDPGHPEELIRGRVVRMPPPGRRHGEVCGQAVYLFKRFLEDHDVGRVLSRDSGVITERGPDTVRGADVAYYSFETMPRGIASRGYGPEIPELVVEVRSPSDRWREVVEKVAEYLRAAVRVVVVLDPDPRAAHVFAADEPPRMLGPDDELTFPGLLDGFAVRVARFFE
jgi:Uma2 family endonuclease